MKLKYLQKRAKNQHFEVLCLEVLLIKFGAYRCSLANEGEREKLISINCKCSFGSDY